MTTYITYQCSVCRRTKDIAQDNVRALPNQCIITKGCSGSLYKIGETLIPESVTPVSGLTDWYARGKKPTYTPVAPAESLVSLTCSASGVVTLAMFLTEAEALANPTVNVSLKQRLSADTPFTEYVYNLQTSTQIISGKDANGKNLRFDQAAIDEGRVLVLVNGVARQAGTDAGDYAIVPNTITFNTALAAGSVVEVSVFSVAPTQLVSLSFVANYSFLVTTNSGAWGNVRWVDEYDQTTGLLKSVQPGQKKWWIYSCTSLASVSTASQLLLTAIMNSTSTTVLMPGTLGDLADARFLLSASPHDNTDRYLNFYIDAQVLADGFYAQSIVTTIPELYADSSALVDIFPPFQLISATPLSSSSFVTADTYSTTDYVSSDTPETRLTGTKIIGPV
jgi:hypothetical protein